MGTRQAKKLRKVYRNNLRVTYVEVLDLINAMKFRARFKYAYCIFVGRKVHGKTKNFWVK